jgi:hypothetical protein
MKNIYILIVFTLFFGSCFCQSNGFNFNVNKIEICNVNLLSLFDVIMTMDSSCTHPHVDYTVSIYDSIIDNLKRYCLFFHGCKKKAYIDTNVIIGCFEYKNTNFFFINKIPIEIGVYITDNIFTCEWELTGVVLQHNIPTTMCLYVSNQIWIIRRDWDFGCKQFNLPMKIM